MPIYRNAIITDATKIGALHVASWAEAYHELLPNKVLRAIDANSRSKIWQKILSHPKDFGGSVVWLAENAGELMGFVSCSTQRDVNFHDRGFRGEITSLYVLQAYQRHGIGRELMARASETLILAGHKSAALWVLRDNKVARTFYESLGGRLISEKSEKRGNFEFAEVAYGWDSVEQLLRSTLNDRQTIEQRCVSFEFMAAKGRAE